MPTEAVAPKKGVDCSNLCKCYSIITGKTRRKKGKKGSGNRRRFRADENSRGGKADRETQRSLYATRVSQITFFAKEKTKTGNDVYTTF